MTATRIPEVTVELGERSYPVRLAAGGLTNFGKVVARQSGASRAIVLTVPEVGRRYAPRLMRSLRGAGLKVAKIEVPDGDATKNLRQVEKLYAELLARGADRGTVLVALGGGMVGDLTGFTAATFLRGIPFVQVPTTVLAMVDASVGGKTGVNLPQGKNLVGAFHQPRAVLIDIETLSSLPGRERAAGFAEVVKAGAIWDEPFFQRLEGCAEELMALEPAALVPVLERAIEIKAEVVSRDEREQGLRMLLNFGHTLGHAIEARRRYRGILHGEAVAIGMVYATRRSEALGVSPAGTADRLEALCQRFGLPTAMPSYARTDYVAALEVDKKKRDAHIRFVVLEGIGAARTLPLRVAEIVADIPRVPGGAKAGTRTADRKSGTGVRTRKRGR
jgi:3-dehydroquinate synthase